MPELQNLAPLLVVSATFVMVSVYYLSFKIALNSKSIVISHLLWRQRTLLSDITAIRVTGNRKSRQLNVYCGKTIRFKVWSSIQGFSTIYESLRAGLPNPESFVDVSSP